MRLQIGLEVWVKREHVTTPHGTTTEAEARPPFFGGRVGNRVLLCSPGGLKTSNVVQASLQRIDIALAVEIKDIHQQACQNQSFKTDK